MKRLVALFLLLAGALHAQTAAQITATVNALNPDNTTGAITPATLRSSFASVITGVGSPQFTIQGIISSSLISATSFNTNHLTATSISATSISATNLTGSVVPGGGTSPVSLVSLTPVVNVLAFGAKCDGVTDDSAALARAFASSVSVTLTQPSNYCVNNSPTTYDTNRVLGYDGNGAGWLTGGITSATAGGSTTVIQLTNSAASNGAIPYEYKSVFTNFNLVGAPSVASASISGMNGIGHSTHNIVLDHVVINGFVTGEVYNTNAYLISHKDGATNHTVNPFTITTCTNCGENISYDAHHFTNNSGPIVVGNANTDVKIAKSSFDINTSGAQWISLTTGNLSSVQNHYENLTGNNATSPLISIGDADAAFFSSVGDRLLFSSGSPPFTGTSSTVFIGARGNAYFCGLDFNATSMLGGSFISGTGRAVFCPGGQHFGAVSNNNPNVATISNTFIALLSDADMESSTAPIPPKDIWTLRTDTAAYGIVSRTAGVNTSLTTVNGSAHTGSQYLAVTKAGVASTASSWRLVVPTPRMGSISGNYWYQKPTTQTGAWAITYSFGLCYGADSNGVPLVFNTQTIGTTSVGSTASTIPWTQVNINMFSNIRSPGWSNCFIMDFNGDSLNAGEIDLDTFVLNAI